MAAPAPTAEPSSAVSESVPFVPAVLVGRTLELPDAEPEGVEERVMERV